MTAALVAVGVAFAGGLLIGAMVMLAPLVQARLDRREHERDADRLQSVLDEQTGRRVDAEDERDEALDRLAELEPALEDARAANDELLGAVKVAEEQVGWLTERLDATEKDALRASLLLLHTLDSERVEHARALAAGTPVHSTLMLEAAAGAGR